MTIEINTDSVKEKYRLGDSEKFREVERYRESDGER